jgi:hypothetical protein
MKKTNKFYWIFTGVITVSLGIGSVLDVMVLPEVARVVTRLGYPEYLVPFLGVARLLGLAVILLPVKKYRLLKEWAYAGLTFDLVGALYSTIAFGDPFTNWIGSMLTILFLAGSYILYHKKLELIQQTA